MSEKIISSFKQLLRKNKDLSFIVITLLGLGAVFMSRINTDHQWIKTYESVMSNMAAGLLIAGITYFIARIFIFKLEDLDAFDQSSNNKNQNVSQILGAISGIENSIQRLEGTQGGYQVFHDKKRLFKQLFSIMEGAQQKILSVGYGFNYNDSEETNLADLFVASIHSFLNTNGKFKEFKHYQFDNYPNTKWLEKLINVKVEFETSFNFYYGSMGNEVSPKWIITVDPDLENTYTIVIFTKEVRNTYSKPFDFVIGYIFNEQTISQKKLEFFKPFFEMRTEGVTDIRGIVQSFKRETTAAWDEFIEAHPDNCSIEPENLIRVGKRLGIYDFELIKNLMLKRLMEGRSFYFAYGLDMNPRILTEKYTNTIKVGSAHIRSHKIELNGRGDGGLERDSLILNIVPLKHQQDTFIHGILYLIGNEEFKLFLDEKEQSGYKVKVVKVKLGAEEFTSKVILQEKSKQNHLSISLNYKNALISWLEREKELDLNYKQQLLNLIS